MKKLVIVLLFVSTQAFTSTIEECNAEIKALNVERLDLQKEPFVEYRVKDHPTINVERRNRRILINRNFVSPRKTSSSSHFIANLSVNTRAFREWSDLAALVPESDRRKKRLSEIESRLKELQKEKDSILRARIKKK